MGAGAAPAGAPSAPRKALAGPQNGRALLSWAAPARRGSSAITAYAVRPYKNGAAMPVIVFRSKHTHQTVTGLANGASYAFAIAARKAAGQGPFSSKSQPVVVGAPSRPKKPVASAGNQQAALSWQTPASSNGAPIDGYVVIAYNRYTPVKTW